MGKQPQGPPPQDPEIPQLKAQQAALDQKLQQEIGQVKAALQALPSSAGLQPQIDTLTASNATLDAAVKALGKSEEAHLQTLHATIQKEIATAFQKMNTQEADNLGQIRTELAQSSRGLEEKLDTQVDELMRGIEGSHNLLSGQLQDAIELGRKEKVEAQEETAEYLVEERKRLDTAMRTEDDALSVRCDALRNSVDELRAGLEQSKTIMHKADMDLAAACEAQFKKLEQQLRDEHTAAQENAKSHANIVVAALHTQVKPQLEGIDHMAWVIDNMYTRTVTWQIQSFKSKLNKLLEQKESVLQSPPFSVCAQPDMIMEMLALPEEESSVPTLVPPLPTAGSASFRIWAQPGCHLGFRMTMGEGSSAIARRFEHTFLPGEVMDSQGRASYLMKNLCQLDQIWSRKANTVSITLEVLELRSGDQVARLVDKAAGAIEEEGIDDADMDEETKDAQLEARAAELETLRPDNIFTSRSLTSDILMQERMQSQLQALRNRTVRRVEWKLEGCARLLDVVKAGEAVDSPLFSAAGVDKMQMHFYPRGCEVGDKVSAHGQACALYISGPYRTSLKGILSVGTNAREFEQRYQRRGDVGGRGKFCNLQSQVDLHDSVTIALEIVEVETDLPEKSATLVFREARSPDPSSPAGKVSHVGGGAKGSMRMKREDPGKTEEVVRCISLPALNTRQQFLPKMTSNTGGNRSGGPRSR